MSDLNIKPKKSKPLLVMKGTDGCITIIGVIISFIINAYLLSRFWNHDKYRQMELLLLSIGIFLSLLLSFIFINRKYNKNKYLLKFWEDHIQVCNAANINYENIYKILRKRHLINNNKHVHYSIIIYYEENQFLEVFENHLDVDYGIIKYTLTKLPNTNHIEFIDEGDLFYNNSN